MQCLVVYGVSNHIDEGDGKGKAGVSEVKLVVNAFGSTYPTYSTTLLSVDLFLVFLDCLHVR